MVVFSKNGDTGFYVEASSQVRIPFNGSEIFINGFFNFGSVSPYYSIVAGIGRDGDKTYLIGRALLSGMKQEGKIRSYLCREIGDYYAGFVIAELERYREENGLAADIVLWKELFNHNHTEQKQEPPSRQLILTGLEDLLYAKK